MATTHWVFIDETAGAACGNGETLSQLALARIAEACEMQGNAELADEWGGNVAIRIGKDASDILPGERPYVFQADFPDEPGASAYHDTDGKGVEVAFCAVTTCGSLFGPDGVSVDASHELGEARADPGCNRLADDGQGTVHAIEVCDPVEVQTYTKTCGDGTVVCVSNFVLQAFYFSGSPGPVDYMTANSIDGAVPPPGPMQTAPSPDGHGNYQIEGTSGGQEGDVFALRIVGTPKKAKKAAHWSSRASRRAKKASKPSQRAEMKMSRYSFPPFKDEPDFGHSSETPKNSDACPDPECGHPAFMHKRDGDVIKCTVETCPCREHVRS